MTKRKSQPSEDGVVADTGNAFNTPPKRKPARKGVSDVNNAMRSEWAVAALDTFARVARMEYEDDQTRLADLLADLMHFARAEGSH